MHHPHSHCKAARFPLTLRRVIKLHMCALVIPFQESKGPFINYVRVPREDGGIGKISTYSYFGGGEVKPILT